MFIAMFNADTEIQRLSEEQPHVLGAVSWYILPCLLTMQ